jgi:predicted metal-dependent peptidase
VRPTRSYLANRGRTASGRRLPWEPGHSGVRRVPKLVLVVDVSGSVEAPLLARFAGEIEALVRRLEAVLVLVVGDERVREVRTVRPGALRLSEIRFEGGAGTDFAPLLAEAARHDPDATIVLTDLQGPAGPPPRKPVLWAVPPAFSDAAVPFGRLLVLR